MARLGFVSGARVCQTGGEQQGTKDGGNATFGLDFHEGIYFIASK